MREIKFRGKAKMSIEELNDMYFEHDNGWFYGNLVMYGDTPYIVGDFIEVDTEYTINEFWVAVHPESVGQYTGLKDKNGKDIYEGDIVKITDEFSDVTVGKVEWGLSSKNYGNYPAFCIYEFESEMNSFAAIYDSGIYEIEVIGNIYEDKHLLKEESK